MEHLAGSQPERRSSSRGSAIHCGHASPKRASQAREELRMTRLLFRDADTLYDLMRADGRLNVPDSEASFGIPIVAPAEGSV